MNPSEPSPRPATSTPAANSASAEKSTLRDLSSLIARTEGIQPWRRLFHACNGVVLALLPGLIGLERAATVALYAAGTLAAFGLDAVRLRAPGVNRWFFAVFNRLASPREARGAASSSWYALGITLSMALFPLEIARAAILVLGLADPAASVIGRIWGRRPLGKGSWLGSTVFLLVATGVLWVALPGVPLALLGLTALTAALAEVFVPRLDDNLIIPLVTGGMLWLVLNVWPVVPGTG